MNRIDPALVNETRWPSVLAVDIGKKGGFCGQREDMLHLQRMPEDDMRKADFIASYNPTVVIMENIHIWAMPGRSMAREEVIVEAKGVIRGICAAMKIPVVVLEPRQWQKHYTYKHKKDFAKNTDKWKLHLAGKALELGHSLTKESWQLDTWTADALLIWNYYAAIVVNKPLPVVGELNFYK